MHSLQGNGEPKSVMKGGLAELDQKHRKHTGKAYDPAEERQDEFQQGSATTHEQAEDSYMEGTIDGKIDRLDEQGELKSHDGKEITRKGHPR